MFSKETSEFPNILGGTIIVGIGRRKGVFGNSRRGYEERMNQRVAITIRGAVQGVGFRPFIYRLATNLRLNGWVSNSSRGVRIEVEGEKPELDAFIIRIHGEKPPRATIQGMEFSFLDPVCYGAFEIRPSDPCGEKTALIVPDIATCDECLAEVFDPANRRYLYPFTNCTNCGPRFSIIESLPYDRPNTSMKKFVMCSDCQDEYNDPANRRFHAQPNACPVCGPRLELWDQSGRRVSDYHEALLGAAELVRSGKILALKGVGGFLFIVDGRNDAALQRLRIRKHREAKPFALMVPTVDEVRNLCELSQLEERLLRSPESPIVLLKRRLGVPKPASRVAPEVAPFNPYLGVMLPYAPLHHILMRELGFPVVATSGNFSDEPLCIDELDAVRRLGSIADAFLVHDRPIVRPIDDSVARVILGREQILRRARGYAPLPVTLERDNSSPILALGGHMKNTVSLSIGKEVFISQHIGDLETNEAQEAFANAIADIQQLHEVKPALIACDLHPDYASTKRASELSGEKILVQHHYAHVAACMAENDLQPPVLGVSWDGTGYGLDGTIWGGEFLLLNSTSFERVAHLRQFRLPGGEAAVKEPRRSALGALYEVFGEGFLNHNALKPLLSFSPQERNTIRQMLIQGLNSPVTSSAGRLFDAVASIIGLRQRVSFEGQAAMELEFVIGEDSTDRSYNYKVEHDRANGQTESILIPYIPTTLIIDWRPMILQILDDLRRGTLLSSISARFHNTLADIVFEVAKRTGVEKVLLTGGCFQSRYLTERCVNQLRAGGFQPYWHQRVPPNDGGISLGQVVVAIRSRLIGKEQQLMMKW